MATYYNIPFNFNAVLTRQRRDQYCCTLGESIIQNISLILSTKFQEFRYDPTFGCKVWEVDFVVPANVNIWKEEIKEVLEEAILKYEYRIDKIKVFRIDVNSAPRQNQKGAQVLDFKIQGTIKGTSKEFEYSDTLFFSPYSR